AALVAGFAARESLLWPILVLLLVMNLLAATQDIATDGLAVDTLSARELGPGNTAQVVGYKLGMLTSGGLLLALFGSAGYAPVLFGIAALCALVWLVMVAVPERALVQSTGAPADSSTTSRSSAPAASTPDRLRPLLAMLVRALGDPSIRWALVFIATYKTGESMIDVMFKPFLVDAGFSRVQLGLWAGTWGSVASISGSVVGGMLALRLTPIRAMGLCALLRVFPLLFQWWLAARGNPQAPEVITVILAEEAFGGALTTSTFAFMMGLVNRSIGASHYTALATLEVLGKLPAGFIAGPIAQQVGYAALFGLGAALSVAFLPIWLLVQRERRRAASGPERVAS